MAHDATTSLYRALLKHVAAADAGLPPAVRAAAA
jgi:hypothetical protein